MSLGARYVPMTQASASLPFPPVGARGVAVGGFDAMSSARAMQPRPEAATSPFAEATLAYGAGGACGSGSGFALASSGSAAPTSGDARSGGNAASSGARRKRGLGGGSTQHKLEPVDNLPKGKIPDLVRSNQFTMFVGGVILLNTICMALQTDFYEMKELWSIVNCCFLLFFVVELALRLYTYRCTFFYNGDWAWNIFDFAIVALSLIDFIFMLIVADEGEKTPMGRYVMLLRMLRILRILRLVHAAPQLMLLVRGVMESMQLVIWIMLMLFMLMLVVAIFVTEQVGNNAELKDEHGNYVFEDPESIRTYWGGVITSWITLFQFLTLDNWAQISGEVAAAPGYGYMQILFDFYVMVAAFAMLSLLTGVIADHMSEVSSSEKHEEKKKQDLELQELFREWKQRERLPEDGITFEQFQNFFHDPEMRTKLEDLGVDIKMQELREFWTFLDRSMDGTLSAEELSHGLKRLRGELQSKDMLRMRCAAERVASRLSADNGPEGCRRKLREVDDCMDSIEVKLTEMTEQLTGFMEFMAQK
eukprot:TRINITY_DN15333_c0_g1_i1.p1 TRINITY_DN15333_c0_g1~~TRINITY_DN15333_c0_g1_i1.p1  ORF type:complete len:534 (+),score=155.53 TRINITY_DN15333_c0_g1_i1:61-1662(+)